MAFIDKIKEEIHRIDDVEKSLRCLVGNEIVCNAEYDRRNVNDCLELADSLRLISTSYAESFALTKKEAADRPKEQKCDAGLTSYVEFPIFFIAGTDEKRLFKVGRSERLSKREGPLIRNPFPLTMRFALWSLVFLWKQGIQAGRHPSRDIKLIWLLAPWFIRRSAFPKEDATALLRARLSHGWTILTDWRR